jgi:hypothetical protein
LTNGADDRGDDDRARLFSLWRDIRVAVDAKSSPSLQAPPRPTAADARRRDWPAPCNHPGAAQRPKETTMRKIVTRILPAFLAVAGLLAAVPACPDTGEGEGEGESA